MESAGAQRPPARPFVPRRQSRLSTLFALALGAFAAVFAKFSLHQVPEGHVGVYWRGGRLLQTISNPGLHLRIPFLDTYAPIQVTLQTDKVRDIPCGTKGGVMIYFEKVEVVNKLEKAYVHPIILEFGVFYDRIWIYDKIHHEINQFCSRHTLQEVYIDKFDQVDDIMKDALQHDCTMFAQGVNILSVRVTKPSIPSSILANYRAMEEEHTKELIAQARERVVTREAEIERTRAVMKAQMEAETSRIAMQQRLAEQEAERQRQEIQDAMFLDRQRVQADARKYSALQEAEANAKLLTPALLQSLYIQAVANNTKLYFGDKIPGMLLDQRLFRDIH
ncbi:hypothetical protein WJX73_002261 [Symbiochloris irregularis]|uniref:Band 7 domain-containing protein n=1 Tax=Symbiochloris irregularis TaxID=706552 RepID=A0AAW1NT34_9CHLO